jgi:hypothetical protein
MPTKPIVRPMEPIVPEGAFMVFLLEVASGSLARISEFRVPLREILALTCNPELPSAFDRRIVVGFEL